jgi:5-methylcytosine-specific restriction endonuclease McrA
MRKGLSQRTRFEVFKRDKFTCQYCGRTPPAAVLHVDHVVPVAGGGPDDQANLVTSCADCNLGKSDVPLAALHRPLQEQMEETQERREQMAAYNDFLTTLRNDEALLMEQLGLYWFNKYKGRRNLYVFGDARIGSIRNFIRLLPAAEIYEAMDIACEHIYAQRREGDYKRWKYFCGICWHKIRRLEGTEPEHKAGT